MSMEEMQAEIASLRLEQMRQKKLWLRWALASYAIAIILVATVLIKVAMTGDDPPPTTIFVVLSYIFLGLVFRTLGRGKRSAG